MPTLFFEVLPPSTVPSRCNDRLSAELLLHVAATVLLARRDCLLSGWEVDAPAGISSFIRPAGIPRGSPSTAIGSSWWTPAPTPRHPEAPIARQTEGQLTLEFRFKLPWRMEVLLAVARLGAGRRECCDHRQQSLLGNRHGALPYEANREYGVKVVADINAKRADVYVDGS